MADITHLYPPTPTNIPPDLTKPSGSYRFRVVIVLLCLIVFVGVYLCLTAGSAYACYYCFAWLGEEEPRPVYQQPVTYQQPNPRGGRPSTYTYPPPPPPRKEKPVFLLILGGIGSG